MVPSAYWIQTYKEGVYDFTSKENSTRITAGTIAHSLARLLRFNGHSSLRWTVGEHSLLVFDIGMALLSNTEEKLQAAPYLLLHDAHEAFLGDMVAPLKKYLKDYKKFDFKELETACDCRIREDLNLPIFPPIWVRELVSEADLLALKLERDNFMHSKHEWVIDDIPFPNIKVAFRKLPNGAPTITRVLRQAIRTSIQEFPRATNKPE